MNDLSNPLKLTYSKTLLVGYRVNKSGDQSGEYVDKLIASNLYKHLIKLKLICEAQIPEFNIPELNDCLDSLPPEPTYTISEIRKSLEPLINKKDLEFYLRNI